VKRTTILLLAGLMASVAPVATIPTAALAALPANASPAATAAYNNAMDAVTAYNAAVARASNLSPREKARAVQAAQVELRQKLDQIANSSTNVLGLQEIQKGLNAAIADLPAGSIGSTYIRSAITTVTNAIATIQAAAALQQQRQSKGDTTGTPTSTQPIQPGTTCTPSSSPVRTC
jgi:hypothetical protein